MNWNQGLRRFHRWLAVAFTLAVLFTSVALAQKEPAVWVSYLPLGPLAFLQITGLYLLLQPLFARWRGGRREV